jgi:hypothetical protein
MSTKPNSRKTSAGDNGQNKAAKVPIYKQPRSSQQAALQAQMFLQTTDAWSNLYFDNTDLHFMERELFG